MKTYEFTVTQEMKGYYTAILEIEAESEEDARLKISKLSIAEKSELCSNWEQGDEADGVGDITIESLNSEN